MRVANLKKFISRLEARVLVIKIKNQQNQLLFYIFCMGWFLSKQHINIMFLSSSGSSLTTWLNPRQVYEKAERTLSVMT